MARVVPIIFRVLFFIFDFAFPLLGVWGNTLSPAFILGGFAKSPTLPPAPETVVLLDGAAGWFAGLIFLHVWLNFSKSHDLSCWKAIQFNLVLVDAFQLLGFYRGLAIEGRAANTTLWRPEDWNNVVGYTVIMTIRLCFVLFVRNSNQNKAKSS